MIGPAQARTHHGRQGASERNDVWGGIIGLNVVRGRAECWLFHRSDAGYRATEVGSQPLNGDTIRSYVPLVLSCTCDKETLREYIHARSGWIRARSAMPAATSESRLCTVIGPGQNDGQAVHARAPGMVSSLCFDAQRAPPGDPGGALVLSGSVAVLPTGARPDEGEGFSVLDEVGVDRSREARIVEFDREIVAALVGALRPGGPDL